MHGWWIKTLHYCLAPNVAPISFFSKQKSVKLASQMNHSSSSPEYAVLIKEIRFWVRFGDVLVMYSYVLVLIFWVFTYFEPFLLDCIWMVDCFIVILHIWDPVAAFLQLTALHSLDEVHSVRGFHQGRIKLSGDTGESLCKSLINEILVIITPIDKSSEHVYFWLVYISNISKPRTIRGLYFHH